MSFDDLDYFNDLDEVVERYSYQIGSYIAESMEDKPDYKLMKIEPSEIAQGEISKANVSAALRRIQENLEGVERSCNSATYRFISDDYARKVGDLLLEADGKPTYSHEVKLLERLAHDSSEGYDSILDMEVDLVRLVRPFDKELSEIIAGKDLKRRIKRSELIEKENGSWVYSPNEMSKIN